MMAEGGALNQHFSFAEITWKIKNISLALCPLKMAISSDDFQMSGRMETMWRMTLRISHEENSIAMFLKMLGPELDFCSSLNNRMQRFRVMWKANILDAVGEEPLSSERIFHFHVRDNKAVETFVLSDILNDLPHLGPDDLTIRCYMLIDYGEKADFPVNVPNGLVELSNALLKLPTEPLFPDILIKVGKMTFSLHKDMFSNAKGLAKLIEQQSSHAITLLNYDATSMEYLFRYLYSGNLSYVLSAPRIRIHEDIERLDIPELRNAYPKEKIELESVIEAREFTASWRIDNLEIIEESLNGPELNEDGMNSRWQIRLHPKGKVNGNEQESNFVFLEASLLESEAEIIDVNMEFNSLDQQDQILYSRREHKRMKVGDKLELPFFRRGGTLMRKCMIDKDIILRIILRISTGDVNVGIGNVNPPEIFDLNNSLTLNLLSKKMGWILQTPLNYDIVLHSDALNIHAHKFVLASRSPVFRIRLIGFTGRALTIPNIKRHFIRVFLEYLYTGLFSDIDFDTNCYMYELGFMFEVAHLIGRCNSEMNPDIVLDILTYADNENLAKVKAQAFNLIGEIGEAITGHSQWDDFLYKKTNLALDVLDFLKKDGGS